MSVVGFPNLVVVDGQQHVNVDNLISGTATAIDEDFLIKGLGAIRGNVGCVINFLRCQISINDVVNPGNWFDSVTAPLTYNGANNDRNNTTQFLHFTDSTIKFRTTSTRAIFISNAINTRIFKLDEGGTFRCYTQGGAVLDGMHLDNIIWEPVLQFSSASNVRLENTGTGFTNFNVTRMDFLYITEVNVSNSASLGTGNSGNNSIVIWAPIAFDMTTIQMSSVNSYAEKGIFSAWQFIDRDNSTNVEDVLLILSSDKSGSMTELGRYLTDSDGLLVGTYDSRFETTGASQVRDTVFINEQYTEQPGPFGTGSFSYDLIPVTTRIEIRSFLHKPSFGYIVGDDYVLTEPQGTIGSNYEGDVFAAFLQNNDVDLTETNQTTISAYIDFGTTAKAYDRQKLEWRNNDNYALIGRTGLQLELNDINVTFDATVVTDYSADTTSQTYKAAIHTGGATATTGKFTIQNGALLNGGTFVCNIDVVNSVGTTITGINHTGILDFDTAGTYTVDASELDEITNSSGGAVTLLLTNASTVTTITGPNITLIQDVDIVNANLLDGTRVQLYNITQDAELDNSVVSGGTGYSFSVNLLSAAVNTGDTLRIRGTYINGVTAKSEYEEAGTVTSSGLSFIGIQNPSPEYDAWGLDGSLITKFGADYAGGEVDIIIGLNFELAELGAWWAYNLTTTQGIRDFFGGLEFVDEANILIHNSIVDIFMDNTTATNVHQTDNRRLYRDDLARPVADPTTGAGGIDVEWRSPVTIANSDNVATKANQIQGNENLKLTSLLIPVSQNLPDT